MRINVAYACNDAYMEQTCVSLISLFENNLDVNEIYIYFIDMGISSDSTLYLNQLVNKYGRKLIIVPFNDIAYDLRINNTGRHIQSVYAKLFFGRLEGIDKILYLDSDIIVADSLQPLWELDLKGCVCAGVETIHSIKANEEMGLDSIDQAINDGMVLMDLALWKRDNYLQQCLDYIDLYNGNPPVLSEGTINAVCKGNILIIHPRYNLMSGLVEAKTKRIEAITERRYYTQDDLDEAVKNPCIIHYLSGFYNRPWCEQCTHPLKDRYLFYRSYTKWANVPLQNKKLPLRLRIIGYLNKYLPIKVYKTLRRGIRNIRGNREI